MKSETYYGLFNNFVLFQRRRLFFASSTLTAEFRMFSDATRNKMFVFDLFFICLRDLKTAPTANCR